MNQTTTQNEKLRALLAEARTVIHQVIYNDTLQDWACESVEDEPSMEDILREMRGRIDATLAEPVETGGAVKGLSNERDHFKAMLRERAEELVAAREEIERLRADKGALDGIIDRLEREIDGPQGFRARAATAFVRGAEAMREAAMGAAWHSNAMGVHNKIRALAIPEDKP